MHGFVYFISNAVPKRNSRLSSPFPHGSYVRAFTRRQSRKSSFVVYLGSVVCKSSNNHLCHRSLIFPKWARNETLTFFLIQHLHSPSPCPSHNDSPTAPYNRCGCHMAFPQLIDPDSSRSQCWSRIEKMLFVRLGNHCLQCYFLHRSTSPTYVTLH